MIKIREIKAKNMNVKKFIDDKVREIREIVGDGMAINALSGGVDSSVVTALGHKALGDRLKTYFIENGIMREGEPARVAAAFKKLGIRVEVIDASKTFFAALKGITDPEEKREAITQTFYKNVFGKLVVKSKAKYLLQGTILTDVDETVAGIKRQHNVFEQLGIDPQKAFGYKILEPLIELRKDGVRKVGRALGLPESMFNRIPFPGPALAAERQDVPAWIIDHMVGTHIIYDENGYFMHASGSVIGYAKEEIPGRHFTEFVIPEQIPQAIQRFGTLFQGKTSSHSYLLRHKDGTIDWATLHCHPYAKGDKVMVLSAVKEGRYDDQAEEFTA
ncbi:MAG TPA: PAS domain S-box protein [Smithella sp.]|nr:PAS domain S-box protein [Smithella sp.]